MDTVRNYPSPGKLLHKVSILRLVSAECRERLLRVTGTIAHTSASKGWEQSSLGYTISDEDDVREGSGGIVALRVVPSSGCLKQMHIAGMPEMESTCLRRQEVTKCMAPSGISGRASTENGVP